MPAGLWADIQGAPADDEVPEPTPEDFPWKVVSLRSRRAAVGDVGDLPRRKNQVLVYTVFQAKGQEAEHVFICGAHADAFRDQDVANTDGLRRLYVAITRAIKTPTISFARDVGSTPLHGQLSGGPCCPRSCMRAARGSESRSNKIRSRRRRVSGGIRSNPGTKV